MFFFFFEIFQVFISTKHTKKYLWVRVTKDLVGPRSIKTTVDQVDKGVTHNFFTHNQKRKVVVLYIENYQRLETVLPREREDEKRSRKVYQRRPYVNKNFQNSYKTSRKVQTGLLPQTQKQSIKKDFKNLLNPLTKKSKTDT